MHRDHERTWMSIVFACAVAVLLLAPAQAADDEIEELKQRIEALEGEKAARDASKGDTPDVAADFFARVTGARPAGELE